MNKKLVVSWLLIIVASELLNVIFKELTGSFPKILAISQLIFLIAATIYFFLRKEYSSLRVFATVLSVIVFCKIFITTSIFRSIIGSGTFVQEIGTNLAWKVIMAIAVFLVLMVGLRRPRSFYFTMGDLKTKAEPISWLGIKKDSITWMRLSFISAILIGTGTIFLVILTVTGFSIPERIDKILPYLPVIIFFALVNSFSEGMACRNGILGPLNGVLSKNNILLLSAFFFGIWHYYGAPAGIVGAAMSSLLEWFLSRAMYETKGFLAPWIIHFFVDFVLFSTIFLFGNFG